MSKVTGLDNIEITGIEQKLTRWIENFKCLLAYLERPLHVKRLSSPLKQGDFNDLLRNEKYEKLFRDTLIYNSVKNKGISSRFYIEGVYELFMDDFKTDVYLVIYATAINVAEVLKLKSFGQVSYHEIGKELAMLNELRGLDLGLNDDASVLLELI